MHGEQIGPEVDLLVLDAQFFPQIVAMELHSIFRDIHNICSLLVGAALPDQISHLDLSWAETQKA